MRKVYKPSYPTPSKSAESKLTECKSAVTELRGELIKQMALNARLCTSIEGHLQTIKNASQRITDLKETVHNLRDKIRTLQYQVDNYCAASKEPLNVLNTLRYKKAIQDEITEKHYYINKLKKEIEKTTQLAQTVTNLKRRNKALLGNFKSIKDVNHDDLELAIGLYTELVHQITILMDRNKPDTTLDYKKTLDEVIQTINQQGAMINEIYTVIHKAEIQTAIEEKRNQNRKD